MPSTAGRAVRGCAGIGNENFDAWADLNSSNALTARRVYGDAVDEVVAKISSAGVETWYETDRQGSVVGLVNGSGTPVETIVYDGFGKVTSDSAPSAGDRYGYAGREEEALAGGVVLMASQTATSRRLNASCRAQTTRANLPVAN